MTVPFSAASLPIICLAAGLAVAGCQPPSERSGIADLTPPDPEPPAAAGSARAGVGADAEVPPEFAGRWFVSAVFPALARQASMADPHLGATLVIDAAESSDVNGQRCLAPQMQVRRSTADLRLGSVALAGLDRLGIACKGRPFATYLLLPGTALDASYQAADASYALVAERPEGLYLLERAEQVLMRAASLPAALAGEGRSVARPASLPATTPAASAPVAKPGAVDAPISAPLAPAPLGPAPMGPAPSKPAATAPLALTPALPEPAAIPAAIPPAAAVTAARGTKLPAAGSAIHLASYKGLSAAKRGWKILLGDFDALDPLSPLYVTVDVPGKGEMVRLYATARDSAELDRACQALLAKGAFCALSR